MSSQRRARGRALFPAVHHTTARRPAPPRAPARRYLPEALAEAYDPVTVRQILAPTGGLPKHARPPGAWCTP
ncbi:hypothetical protein [Streptomyces katrae]|uniref:hypothetical protein n=1 Tax=Streptomyces katrae TaxID=68223 RepID=UPI00131D0B51|nr:hypothetical protein [Streptomyces katrae]